MKKLLILGGTAQQIKLVEAAKKRGIYTIVTDYLKDSPAKKIADKAYIYDIKDIDGIVAMCQKEQVNAVICGYIDPCQRPYQQICERLQIPCYGTKEQFFKMTDKHAFKKMCMENGVDVIPEYSERDIEKNCIEYPVFVKPVDSRGSRGQEVCYNKEELDLAVKVAKKESSNGDILIEKYMKDAHEFQVTYFFINGEAFLIRTVDSYCGPEDVHMEKVVACAVSPSRFTESYLKNAHQKVVKMFKNMGFKNGPIFMQGFEDHGVFRFFDPGLRFPGVDYEKIYTKILGIDIMDAMIDIALEGHCNKFVLPEDGVWLEKKRAAVFFPTISAGKIAKINGEKEIRKDSAVISYIPRCTVGEKLEWTYNVNQRMAEIDIVCDNTEQLKQELASLQEKLKAVDEEGHDMSFTLFDVDRIC